MYKIKRMGQKSWPVLTCLLLLLAAWPVALQAETFAVLAQDRTAIERVYYNHRLGRKPPFDQVSPASLIERLVKDYLHKEAILKKVYGVEITVEMLDAEVQRINTTTQAPEMLDEIKAALGKDPARFARAFAKPFLIERLLRDKFENDDALHAAQRGEAERVRAQLLAARSNGPSESRTNQSAVLASLKAAHSHEVSEITWQLGAHSAETNALAADELEIKKQFGPDAQLLASSSSTGQDREFYFSDLPPALQNVLRLQLRQPGDVSAVIETPSSFLLYACTAKTAETLSVATLSLPKRNFEQWLNEQSETP